MYLHILLGIVLKHHNFLLSETHVIDMMLADNYSKSKTYNDLGLEKFDKYVKAMRRREVLQENVIDYDCLLIEAVDSNAKKKIEEEHINIAIELGNLDKHFDNNSIKPSTGPVSKDIEKTLKNIK